ncbi:unnamed protein product [Parnassius mnemosyne]|uniref:Reverse transcriptase domain-containing protein n=1 Tax=Parnassius mnemosyne TaxID=213953 RepID=A0AAV1KYN6_9NEOP
MHSSKTQYTVLMGDFNARLGTRENGELKVGKFGIGQRNSRGQQLTDFMEKEGLFMMNSFFQKRPHRKWTWSSPDGSTKNEIDFIMTTRRLSGLDDFQIPEQAGFRKGFSTIDHIHTLRQIVQKSEEYNLPLCLAYVDYEKAFDSVEIWTVLQSLQRCQVDCQYIEVLKYL